MEQNVTKPSFGLHTDNLPTEQPKGTYRFALNAVNETRDGSHGFISNELGFEPCGNLPIGYRPVGDVYIGRDRIVIFSTNNLSTTTSSEIGIQDKECNYVTKINDPCFGFDNNEPTDVTFRVVGGCREMLYFIDGNKIPRVYEIGREYDDVCAETKLIRDYEIPCITVNSVNGGDLLPGSYEVGIRYIDEDGNETNVIDTTLPVRVYRDNVYDIIEGDFSNQVDPINGIPTTGKSLRVSITDLDSRYVAYRLVIAASTSGTGFVSEYLESPQIPITQEVYVFDGSTSGFTTTTEADVRLGKIPIESAEHIEQIENRLLLANTKSKAARWCDFQAFVNQINAEWVLNEIDADDQTIQGNNKHPNTLFAGFMGDEVYAFGIVFVYSDGTISPVFHIPGREINAFDMQAVTNNDALCVDGCDSTSGTDDCNNPTLSPVDAQRWQVYDTSFTYNTPDPCYAEAGTFGYYQCCNATYPTDLNCDGVTPIWGTLAGEPIRHHKFPSRRTHVHFANGQARVFGVRFSNITYPDPDIVSHYFVMANRTEENKTVLDNGFLKHLNFEVGSTGAIHNQFGLFNTLNSATVPNELTFMSPKAMVEKKYMSGDYFTLNSMWQQDQSVFPTDIFPNDNGDCDDFLQFKIDFFYAIYDEAPLSVAAEDVNFCIEDSVYVAQKSSQSPFGVFGSTIINHSDNNDFYIFKTAVDFPNPNPTGNHYYVSLKRNRDVYCQLDGLTYRRLHNCALTLDDDQTVFGGDSYISRFDITNIIRRDAPSQVVYGAVSGGLYSALANGDIFAQGMRGLWVESDLNLGLRAGNDGGDCRRYSLGDGLTDIYDFILESVSEIADPINGCRTPRADVCDEFWQVNPDFQKYNQDTIDLPLPLTFDCCSDCLEEFPTRVWYSEQSFQEEQTDNYRFFRANNYRDIESEHGEITNLWRKNNTLYIHTVEALWQLPQNVQERVTDDVVTFLGTGDFFAIPPRKVIDADIGSAGSQHKWATVKTRYGVFFVDQLEHRVYLFDDGLQELSLQGNRNWFENHLKDFLGTQFRTLTGLDYPYLNTPYKIGIHAAYDARFKRILLTKIDYEIDEDLWGGVTDDANTGLATDVLFWDTSTEEFFVNDTSAGIVRLDVGDPRFFCNKSFTMSYSLVSKTWVSWHSYFPAWYIQGKNHLLSINYKGRDAIQLPTTLFRHNREGFFQNYYGSTYPHIIEYVSLSDPKVTKVWEDITIQCDARDWFVEQQCYLDNRFTTFTSMMVWNTRQHSGELQLVVKDTETPEENYLINQVTEISGQIDITREERNWNINGFRDMVDDYNNPMMQTSCSGNSMKIVNPLVINLNKPWHEQEVFRDNYLQVRLIFDNHTDIELTTRFSLETEEPSKR